MNNEHVDLVKEVVIARIAREEMEGELVKLKISYAELLGKFSEGLMLNGGGIGSGSGSGTTNGQKGFLLRR